MDDKHSSNTPDKKKEEIVNAIHIVLALSKIVYDKAINVGFNDNQALHIATEYACYMMNVNKGDKT